MIIEQFSRLVKGALPRSESISVIASSDDAADARRRAEHTRYLQTITANAAAAIPAPGANRTIAVLSILVQNLSTTTASTVTVVGLGTNWTIPAPREATGIDKVFGTVNPLYLVPNTALGLNVGAAVSHSILIQYLIVDAVTRVPV